MHEISDLMQGYTVSKVTNNVVCICVQYFFTIFRSFLTETITIWWKNTVSICIPYCWLPRKMWSLAWDHWFHAWDAQCMCIISVHIFGPNFRFILHNNNKITKTDISLKPIMVHIHWASHARNQWSHARLHIFLGKQQCGIHMYAVFFHYIVIVSD